ncbi:hypothetical protein ACIQZB_33545 [Streptomyces sp. NPDC097727]|uniref:hypothetical protein n=1 Tax=Streptomyces sp. NPDC097727 TaxID=3366092 RepID=UPI003823AEF7
MATRLFADDPSAGTFTDFILRCFEWIDRPPFISRHWPGKLLRYHPLKPTE